MTPDRIGRYPIIVEIGRGGFASVYLAEDRHLDSRVAIKMLAESFTADPDIVSRFVAEARFMRNLAAPGLVAVYDSGEHEGRPYFVMEYCERGTLASRLDGLGRPLTVDEGLGLARSMAEAVSAVHRATPPVVHRDLKPGNLLIRHTPNRRRTPVGELLAADEELAVGDFGLAKVVDPTATRMTIIAYTRGFAAPEQARGEAAITPRADVYSASAVMTAAISGRAPEAVLGLEDRAFDDQALRATGSLRAELERGLSYDHRQRHVDIDAWIEALDAAANQAASTIGPAAGGRASDRGVGTVRSRRPRALVAAAVVALLAVVGLVAVVGPLAFSDGPSLTGPSEGFVGDEVSFVVTGSEVAEWRLPGSEFEGDLPVGQVLTFTPDTEGPVNIEVVTDDGAIGHQYLVSAPPSDLRIEGSGHLVVGEPATLTVSGGGDQTLVWTVNGGDRRRQTSLELRPTTVGLIAVEVTTGNGESTRRTFTAAAATP